jgi:hypothetical protein
MIRVDEVKYASGGLLGVASGVNIATGVLPSHTYSRSAVPAASYSPSNCPPWSYTKITALADPDPVPVGVVMPVSRPSSS